MGDTVLTDDNYLNRLSKDGAFSFAVRLNVSLGPHAECCVNELHIL